MQSSESQEQRSTVVRAYAAPQLVSLGTLRDLTNHFGASGFSFGASNWRRRHGHHGTPGSSEGSSSSRGSS